MDPSLIQQHKAFKNRSLALPVVEKSSFKRENASYQYSKPNKLQKISSSSLASSSSSSSIYSKPQVNKHKFALLAEIVKHMKSRHQKGYTHALALDEMLEECKLEGMISSVHKNWLQNEALENNPKIQVINEGIGKVKYAFKPKYNIKDKKALLRLLDRHDQRGLGGIMRDDIEEGLPHAGKCIKNLKNKILFVTRPDKKQIAFYNDRSCDIVIDEEFQKLWRAIAVDSIDDNKIEEYLNSHGITSVQETVKQPVTHKRKKVNRKRRKFNAHNDHLGDMLKDYSVQN